MKKINKINLSGVEHLSEQDAKEYVAECNSTEGINADARSGDSGTSGGGTGTGSVPSGVIIMPECEGRSEGGDCSYSGRSGFCAFRKVQTGGIIFKDYAVALTCKVEGNPTSGTDLSSREYACIGQKRGENCYFDLSNGATRYGVCIYNKWSIGKKPLFCAENDYD